MLDAGTLDILEPDDGEVVFKRKDKEQVPPQKVGACMLKCLKSCH